MHAVTVFTREFFIWIYWSL